MMTPASEAELAETIAGLTGPVRIRGGGSRFGHGGGDVLCTAGLNGVSLHEPGALTLVAGAGTPLADIESILAAQDQRLAFEPMDHRVLLGTGGEPTIGGVVAGNISGPRRIAVGACRDHLLGVRLVDGSGTVVKNGGRVMKNVTGYDLVKLMAGSWGTLGVLTEVAVKVLPTPAAAATVMIDGLEDARAVEAMSMALGSPFEVTGAAHAPHGDTGAPLTMLRLEGFAASVAYRAGKLSDLLAPFGPVRVEDKAGAVGEIWRRVRDVQAFAGREGDVWRISVKPSDAPGIAALAQGEVLYDWGGGLIWVLVPEGTDLRARIGAFAGHATLIRASDDTRARLPVFHPEPAAVARLSAGLRARFDPRGILNPGLMA